jgi:hypothetical protein
MNGDVLTPAIVEFLTQHIASLDELEILMLLVQASTRWFDAATAARHLGLSPERAHSALDALAARNLLDIRISDDVRYQFRPGRPDLEHVAVAAAEAYRRRPALIVHVVSGGASRGVRDFSDAFRFRRRRDG